MDPVSHLAFGRLAIALDREHRLGRGATAACLAGSLSPDLDAVFMPAGWDVYLLHHQGGTHSLIGSIGCAALVAIAAHVSLKGSWFRSLLLAAWAGAAGHLLLDLVSGADLRLAWPVGPRTALPLFAMADPWLGGILVLGIVGLALRPHPRRNATDALLLVGIVAGGKALLYTRARALHQAATTSTPAVRGDVEWGSLSRWIMYEARPDTVYARRVNALTGEVTPLLGVSRGLRDPLAIRSREFRTVQNLLASHDITFAVVSSGEREVLWSDLRYCGPVGVRSAPWAPAVAVGASPVSCALWVGGEFDPVSATLGSAIVYIGRVVQRRRNR
jgi:membrane-bound metal-dependent hydrolase YbcI (DUF457 family)